MRYYQLINILTSGRRDVTTVNDAHSVENDATTGTYADKWCEATNPETQHCMISFLLKAAFFDHSAMTLT